MRRWIVIAALICSVKTQAQLINRVLAAPDYTEGTGLVVKWLTEKGVYPQGFKVYRAGAGDEDWQLTGSTVKQEPDMDRLRDMNKTLMQSYAIFYEKSFDYVQENAAHRAILYLNLARSEELSRMLGMTYFDESAMTGLSYRYRVTGVLEDGTEELIGETAAITMGQYQRLAPPDSITLVRLPDGITMRWHIDLSQSATTIIEKSVDGGAFIPMTELPLYVSQDYDSLGSPQWPEVYFFDTEIDSLSSYRYRLAAVDYFGQPGEFSEPVILEPVDFVPPPAPADASILVDDRAMTISMAWSYPTPPDDLAGFVVLQRTSPEQDPTVLSEGISGDSRETTISVNNTGEFLLTIGALDDFGNLTESTFLPAKVDDLVPPAIPQTVAISQDSSYYKISWQPGAEDDVSGYFVYRAMGEQPADPSDYQVITGRPVESTTFTDSLGNELKGTLWYAVAAVDSSFNISELSPPATYSIPDALPPAQPFLTAPVISEAGIRLEWLPNVDEDLKHWVINRGSAEDTIRMIQSPDSTGFLDANTIGGVSYSYSMYAEDLSGNQSPPTPSLTVTAPGVDDRIFAGILPTSLSLKYQKKDKTIRLSWDQTFTEDNLGVVVYKGSSKSKLRPVSGQLKATGYEDKRVEEGTTYYYQLRTYAANGLNKKSEIKEITLKASDK
jgi:fibronectin type 3 domain-containing protein